MKTAPEPSDPKPFPAYPNKSYASCLARCWAGIVNLVLGIVFAHVIYQWISLGFEDSVILLVILWCVAKFRTIGGIVTRTRVVDSETANSPTPRQHIIRLFGVLVSCLAFGIGFLVALSNDRKQGWHDRMAETVVINYGDRSRYLLKNVLGSFVVLAFIGFVLDFAPDEQRVSERQVAERQERDEERQSQDEEGQNQGEERKNQVSQQQIAEWQKQEEERRKLATECVEIYPPELFGSSECENRAIELARVIELAQIATRSSDGENQELAAACLIGMIKWKILYPDSFIRTHTEVTRHNNHLYRVRIGFMARSVIWADIVSAEALADVNPDNCTVTSFRIVVLDPNRIIIPNSREVMLKLRQYSTQ